MFRPAKSLFRHDCDASKANNATVEGKKFGLPENLKFLSFFFTQRITCTRSYDTSNTRGSTKKAYGIHQDDIHAIVTREASRLLGISRTFVEAKRSYISHPYHLNCELVYRENFIAPNYYKVQCFKQYYKMPW